MNAVHSVDDVSWDVVCSALKVVEDTFISSCKKTKIIHSAIHKIASYPKASNVADCDNNDNPIKALVSRDDIIDDCKLSCDDDVDWYFTAAISKQVSKTFLT